MFHWAQLSIAHRFELLLKSANWALLIFFIIFVASIFLAYVIHPILPMAIQMFSHLLLLLSAFAIKIAYVVRCIAQYQLGLEVC